LRDYAWGVPLDRWDEIGDAEQTEHWRSVLPELSVDPGEDLTGVSNGLERVAAIRQQHVLEFKHLTGPRGSWHGSTATGLTRVSDWSALTEREQTEERLGSPFALCRGVASGLIQRLDLPAGGDLDFAIRVSVPPTFLPLGLLLLHGASIVVHRVRPFRTMPGSARWPYEVEVPDYLMVGASDLP
jgi:hypothetical protein